MYCVLPGVHVPGSVMIIVIPFSSPAQTKTYQFSPASPAAAQDTQTTKKSPAIKCLITPTFMSVYLQFYVSIYYDVDIKLCFCTEYNLILIQTRSFDVYFK